MDSPVLEVRHITKSFGAKLVLRDVSFSLSRGEILCLLGPSGCGKSTLLNIIAGLERADQGEVLVEHVDIGSVPVHRRGFGLMFQGLALFPHKNVRDNVAFGLRMLGLPNREISARVGDVLNLVGLSGFEMRDVNELSGGEQQRVALARSLAPRPRLLMLDEPLSSLDRTLRERLMDELREILTRVGQTAIYVTHDQQEAFALSDRLVILNEGRVAQTGGARDIYLMPADSFVARFLGMTNLLQAHIATARTPTATTPIGPLVFEADACIAGEITLLIRPDAVLPAGHENTISGVLIERSFRGRMSRIAVQVNAVTLWFDVDSTMVLPSEGAVVTFSLSPSAIQCITPDKSSDPNWPASVPEINGSVIGKSVV